MIGVVSLMKRRSTGAAGAHREDVAARIDHHEGFLDEVRSSWWSFVGVAGGGLMLLVWGIWTAVNGTASPLRLAGAVVALAGLLIWASYAARFQRGLFDRPGWSLSRPRRAARLVLKHAWWVYLAASGLLAIGYHLAP